ncbi:MAG TPA: hypothetical protein VF980_10810 [Thermoanaerobaculia bacterium]
MTPLSMMPIERALPPLIRSTSSRPLAVLMNGFGRVFRIAGGTYANGTALNSLGTVVGDGDTGERGAGLKSVT